MGVVFLIDRFGSLTASAPGRPGPERVGHPDLVPGSAVAAIAFAPTLVAVLAVDASGALGIATYETGLGWQSTATIGDAGFAPGSAIATFAAGGVCVAALIDRNGIFNALACDASGVWSAPATVGGPVFPPGAAIRACARSATQVDAYVVDQAGVLEVLAFDAATGWSGPETIGNALFAPGAPITGAGA